MKSLLFFSILFLFTFLCIAGVVLLLVFHKDIKTFLSLDKKNISKTPHTQPQRAGSAQSFKRKRNIRENSQNYVPSINNSGYKESIQKKQILTATEQKFFKLLVYALPEFFVFTQVSFGALLTHRSKKDFGVRKYFSQKIADFVIMNHDFEVLAIVELDDKWHNSHKRQENDKRRDEMLRHAGYKIIRYRCENMPAITTIRQDVIP